MNKQEMVAKIKEETGCTKKDVEAVLESFRNTVIDAVAAGDKIQMVGFGTFGYSERSEREGKNPRTGEKLIIPATRVPVFKASKQFKDALK